MNDISGNGHAIAETTMPATTKKEQQSEFLYDFVIGLNNRDVHVSNNQQTFTETVFDGFEFLLLINEMQTKKIASLFFFQRSCLRLAMRYTYLLIKRFYDSIYA